MIPTDSQGVLWTTGGWERERKKETWKGKENKEGGTEIGKREKKEKVT